MPRTIILSLSAALEAMTAGRLTEDQLKEAIFCLGCTRAFAMGETSAVMQRLAAGQREKVEPATVANFTEFLKKAELEGRVVWRRKDTREYLSPSDVHLNLTEVLRSHGLKPLNPNLPPISDGYFLKVAIEVTNNEDGKPLVHVVL